VKKTTHRNGIVYSTDPDFRPDQESDTPDIPPPGAQKLVVTLQTKHRAGKTVTLISGFQGPEAEAEKMVKSLKTHCGTGGSAKAGELILQGDHRQKVLLFLQGAGFTQARRGN